MACKTWNQPENLNVNWLELKFEFTVRQKVDLYVSLPLNSSQPWENVPLSKCYCFLEVVLELESCSK